MPTSKRWQKESGELLDTIITPPKEIIESVQKQAEKARRQDPGTPDGDTPPSPREESSDAEKRLRWKQKTAGGRPKTEEAPSRDPLIPYNFKAKASQIERLRALSLKETRTLRELLTEAIEDLLEKYKA